MLKYWWIVLVVLFGSSAAANDQIIKDKVLQLDGPKGSCTGVQVQAPSGKNYILTAGHCKDLAVKGKIKATLEDGEVFKAKILAEDMYSDLLVLEGVPFLPPMRIASKKHNGEKIKTYTHGHRYKTYKTEGVIVQDEHTQIPFKEIKTPMDMLECMTTPKYWIVNLEIGMVCALDTDQTIITAMVTHGSSGGPVMNMKDELVGIVSAEDDKFGTIVRLEDIHRFMRNR